MPPALSIRPFIYQHTYLFGSLYSSTSTYSFIISNYQSVYYIYMSIHLAESFFCFYCFSVPHCIPYFCYFLSSSPTLSLPFPPFLFPCLSSSPRDISRHLGLIPVQLLTNIRQGVEISLVPFHLNSSLPLYSLSLLCLSSPSTLKQQSFTCAICNDFFFFPSFFNFFFFSFFGLSFFLLCSDHLSLPLSLFVHFHFVWGSK